MKGQVCILHPIFVGLTALFLYIPNVNGQCGLQSPPEEESFDTSTMPPSCWSETLVSGTGWESGQLGDAGYQAANIEEHTGNGGYYAFVDFSGGADTTWLNSPKVDASGMTQNPQVVYWFYSNNTNSTGNNILELQAYNGTGWVTVQTHQQNDSNWVRATADLSAYTFSDTVRVRFGAKENVGMSGSPYHNDILLDDIQIRETPSCPEPISLNVNALSSDSVVLSWTSNAGGSEWQIHYDTAGFSLGTGDTINTMMTTDTITGLNPSTSYDFYVREICGGGDSSAWAGPISSTTLCANAYSAVYPSGFDQTGTNTPICWSTVDPNANVEVVTSTGHDDNLPPVSASQMVELNDGDLTTGDTAMLVSPKLIGLGAGDKQLKVWVNQENGGSSEYLIIGTMSSSSNGATWTPYDTIPESEIPQNGWSQKTIKLMDTSLIGSDSYIGIAHGAGAFELYLDDFRYEFIPDSNLALTAINGPIPGCMMDPDSVTIEVTNKGIQPQSGFDVAYSVNGGAPVVETVSQTVPPFDTISYTFAATSAFAGDGTYDITAYTLLSGDTINGNDTMATSVINGTGTLVPSSSSMDQSVPSGDYTFEDTLFVCGASKDLYKCARILTLTIDSIAHEDALDELDIQLVSPQGTTLNLWMQLGGASDRIITDLTFTDTASQNITSASGPPYSGIYHPQEGTGFSKFQGEQLNGMWRLRIFNDDGLDTASFHGWNLRAIDPSKPQPDLGPDTTICKRENLLLDPGDDTDWSYVWGDNSTDSTQEIVGSFLDTNSTYSYRVTVTDERLLNQCSNSDTINVTVENCTDIQDLKDRNLSFKVHPNPVSKRLHIRTSGLHEDALRYELLDLQGRTLGSKVSDAKRSFMDLSELSKGTYILKGYRKGKKHPIFQQRVVVN
ncbi:MAG: T9SS type A sorting domain-containing protein [Flavobacteriales bacterium]